MDKIVKEFAEQMQYKLDKNEHKKSWAHYEITYLLSRLKQETLELEEALMNQNLEKAQNEAADVSNFAMMIFDNISKKSC